MLQRQYDLATLSLLLAQVSLMQVRAPTRLRVWMQMRMQQALVV
jgi:hypothetical protein